VYLPTVATPVTALVGNTTNLTSLGAMSPQWYFNGGPIYGATSPTLQLNNMQISDSGSYTVIYTGTSDCGATVTQTSQPYILTVNTPTCVSAPANLIAWYRGEGNVNDTQGTYNGTANGTITYPAGYVGQGLGFNGQANYVNLGAALGNFGAGEFTIQFWINTLNTTETEELISKRSTCDSVNPLFDIRLKANGQITFGISGTNGLGVKSVLSSLNKPFNNGAWHHYAVTRSGTAINVYVDGSPDTAATATATANINNTANCRIGKGPCVGSDGTAYFTGTLDEIQFYNRALSASEILGIAHANGGVCP
jgi:hypothetical protein